LIRACVGRGDGTSNMILQGLQRVRLIHFLQLPFSAITRPRSRPMRLERRCWNFTRALKSSGGSCQKKSIAMSLT
jgi:hypothetical protein